MQRRHQKVSDAVGVSIRTLLSQSQAERILWLCTVLGRGAYSRLKSKPQSDRFNAGSPLGRASDLDSAALDHFC